MAVDIVFALFSEQCFLRQAASQYNQSAQGAGSQGVLATLRSLPLSLTCRVGVTNVDEQLEPICVGGLFAGTFAVVLASGPTCSPGKSSKSRIAGDGLLDLISDLCDADIQRFVSELSLRKNCGVLARKAIPLQQEQVTLHRPPLRA